MRYRWICKECGRSGVFEKGVPHICLCGNTMSMEVVDEPKAEGDTHEGGDKKL